MAETIDKPAATEDDLIFMDMLLLGWGAWALNEPGPSGPVAAGRLLRIASILDAEYTMKLTDDEFTAVDKKIAVLEPRRYQEIVNLEYRSYWHGRRLLLTQEQKWARLRLGYTAYGNRLKHAKGSMFDAVKGFLARQIDLWRARPR